jgi:ABC-2 type transport system permease protein
VLPRALFGVLNTFLYFPSGAVSPPESFPGWMRALSVIDPLTYGVHAFKALLLRDAGWSAIGMDLGILTCFSLVMLGAATLLLKRTL